MSMSVKMTFVSVANTPSCHNCQNANREDAPTIRGLEGRFPFASFWVEAGSGMSIHNMSMEYVSRFNAPVS
ncbi:MAG: hypothetical protein ACXQTL_07225 [Methanosarcinales archaeon]